MKLFLPLLGLLVVGIPFLAWFLSHRARQARVTALVFLLKEPRPIADWQVRQAAARALHVELAISSEPGPNTVVPLAAEKVQRSLPRGAGTTYLINTGRRMFLLNAFSQPYMEDPARFAERIPDLRLRNAVASHCAWISADLFGKPPSRSERAEIYAALGRMLAPFASDNCLAVYCPELERCNEFAPKVVETLGSGTPLVIFEEPTFAPVLKVDGEDPRMMAAVEEARRRWPEFVRAFECRGRSQSPFIIKAQFTEGDQMEYMWLSVLHINMDEITARLENTPAGLQSVKEGDIVTVPVSEVNDWVCEINRKGVGGFTMMAIKELHQAK